MRLPVPGLCVKLAVTIQYIYKTEMRVVLIFLSSIQREKKEQKRKPIAVFSCTDFGSFALDQKEKMSLLDFIYDLVPLTFCEHIKKNNHEAKSWQVTHWSYSFVDPFVPCECTSFIAWFWCLANGFIFKGENLWQKRQTWRTRTSAVSSFWNSIAILHKYKPPKFLLVYLVTPVLTADNW